MAWMISVATSWARARWRGASLLCALIASAGATVPPVDAAPPSPSLRLYAINCGRLDYPDMDGFSDTDDYVGETGFLVVSCFLVRHGAEWLLWDTGVGDRIAALPNGEVKQNGRFTLRRTLVSQLAQIGLAPDDIHYVALSHLHSEHAGDIGRFPPCDLPHRGGRDRLGARPARPRRRGGLADRAS